MRPLLAAIVFFCTAVAATAAEAPDYAQVRLVFQKHCLACHDMKQKEGELVMETFAGLIKGGDNGSPIVPGKADESPLVKQIERREKPFMPPKKAKDTLNAEEIALIRAWIDAGAAGPKAGDDLPVKPLVTVPKIEPKGTPRQPVRAVSYTAQGKLAAVAKDQSVEVIRAESRGVARRLSVDHGVVNAIAFSADGTKLAAGAGEPGVSGEIKLWNVTDGTLFRTFTGHSDAVYSVAISPDGHTLATGSYDQKIILWDLDTGEQKRTLAGHNGAVMALAFRPDGSVLASASADRTIKLWDLKTGQRLDTFAEPTKEQNTVVFSPDGRRLFAGGGDNRIRVWQISPDAKEGTNHILAAQFAHEGSILRLALSSDGKTLVSTADDKTVKVWDVTGNPVEKHVLPPQPDWPAAAAFALDDNALLVGRLDGSIAWYSPKTGEELAPPKPELASIEPRGIQRGQSVRLKLTGKNLDAVTSVKFSDPRLTARLEPGDNASDREAVVELSSPADLPTGTYEVGVTGPGGQSASHSLFVDDLPQVAEGGSSPPVVTLPASVWSHFEHRGDVGRFEFAAKAGQTVVLDAATTRLGSKANVMVELLDSGGRMLASSNGLDADREPLLAYTVPADGKYAARVTELEAAASKDHFYRVSVGSFAYVTGCYPLAIAPNSETQVHLVGFNVRTDATAVVKAGAAGESDVPVDASRFRTRRPVKVMVGSGPEPLEAEPNDKPEQATPIAVGGSVNGRIDHPGDVDLYRFDAKSGQKLVIETLAARPGSPADTRIEVLHADGSPVERVQLRAVRDSSITFRGIDAGSGGARLVNWEEMELNQYLYLSGEVVKLFLAPRGPDSEFGFYTLNGRRRCYFDTTAVAHPLDEPCYIVEPHAAGEKLPPNGLPVFMLYYSNDDDADHALGSDSRLLFTAPADGSYLVRVTDARGFGGERYVYRLTVRPAVQDFSVTLNLINPTVPAGSGKDFAVSVNRIDGFDDPVKVEVTGLPPGFIVSSPLVIEAGHSEAKGTLFAAADAPAPTPENAGKTKLVATAIVSGKEVTKPVNNFGTIALGPKPGILVGLDPVASAATTQPTDKPVEITVIPGQMTPTRLHITRNGNNDAVTFEVDNLPHGVIVADIGLSGVLIPEKETERQIFLHCAPWVTDQDRLCYARANEAGRPTSAPVLIHVRRPQQQAQSH